MRPTVEALTPACLVRRLQWVELGGFWRVVLRMISSPLSAPTAWTKRFRQRATNWRQTDTCAAIGLFCRPAAASRTILARSARRTATRRARAYPFNCLRWVSVSVTRGAVRTDPGLCCRDAYESASHTAVSSNAWPNLSTSKSISSGEMTSGGENAMVSPGNGRSIAPCSCARPTR